MLHVMQLRELIITIVFEHCAHFTHKPAWKGGQHDDVRDMSMFDFRSVLN